MYTLPTSHKIFWLLAGGNRILPLLLPSCLQLLQRALLHACVVPRVVGISMTLALSYSINVEY